MTGRTEANPSCKTDYTCQRTHHCESKIDWLYYSLNVAWFQAIHQPRGWTVTEMLQSLGKVPRRAPLQDRRRGRHWGTLWFICQRLSGLTYEPTGSGRCSKVLWEPFWMNRGLLRPIVLHTQKAGFSRDIHDGRKRSQFKTTLTGLLNNPHRYWTDWKLRCESELLQGLGWHLPCVMSGSFDVLKVSYDGLVVWWFSHLRIWRCSHHWERPANDRRRCKTSWLGGLVGYRPLKADVSAIEMLFLV